MSRRDDRIDAMPAPLESAEQIAFADWADSKGLLWFHVPNESALTGQLRKSLIGLMGETAGREKAAKLGKMVGGRLRRMGLKSGVSDNVILSRSRKMIDAGALGIMLELKRIRSAEPTQAQVEWILKCRQRGWIAGAARGAEEGIKFCEDWGL
jgi:hypothetical protein